MFLKICILEGICKNLGLNDVKLFVVERLKNLISVDRASNFTLHITGNIVIWLKTEKQTTI